MHIIQIKKETETWLAAISPDKVEITDYLGTLSVELQADASCFEIPFETFPLIIIEHTLSPHDSGSYFEYCGFETLQKCIDEARQNRVESEDHVYFKYYYISEEYFQMLTNDNFMKYMQHTSVTNYELDQPYQISLFHEEIKRNVSNYDIDRLDELFEHTKTRFNSRLEKEDLAINGYESLFWDMNYDHACGKLTDIGIQYLLPMVDKMELLSGEKKWRHRSFALHILLEEVCKDKSETAPAILADTVEAFEQYLISEPNEKLEIQIHRLLSLAYRWMILTNPSTAFQFWRLAVQELEKAIDFDPEEASWSSLFELIYIPYSEDPKISHAQAEAQKVFNAKALDLEITLGAAISYPIALAYQHLQGQLEWKKIDNVFPQTIAMEWAEKAITYNPEEISRFELHECTQFFHQIGLKTNRIDFLMKTISLYERVVQATSDCGLEVYYIAKLWKEIAEIHHLNNAHQLADAAIGHAILLYEKHSEVIKANPSMYRHYAEFLEYCYAYPGNITKPSLAELKKVAIEVEIQSEGFLSYPYVLLMRIALFENNETQAIVHATKCLILHELCADATFDELLNEFKGSDFNQVKDFLSETKRFMEEVDQGYYYHPEVKWKDLKVMSAEELLAYWEKRKEEIRNRPPHNIE